MVMDMEAYGMNGVMDIIIIGCVLIIMEVLADIIIIFLILFGVGVMVIIIHFIDLIIIHTFKINGTIHL